MQVDLDAVGIELFARCLKDAYLLMRRQTRPDSRGLGTRFDADVTRVAAALFFRHGSPYGYMQYVFDKSAEFGSDISYPGIFLSDKMVNRYFLDRVDRYNELKLIAQLQTGELEHRLSMGETLSEVLMDSSAQLNAVFRYAAACSAECRKLADCFVAEACEMLLFEPYYRELFSKWLPEEMKDERALVTEYLRRNGAVPGTPVAQSEGVSSG
jgi:hypothetical protein